MPGERGADRLAGLRVPEAQRAVVAARDEAAAVGGDGDAHTCSMPGERGADRLAGLRVPEAQRVVRRRPRRGGGRRG